MHTYIYTHMHTYIYAFTYILEYKSISCIGPPLRYGHKIIDLWN